MAKNAFIRAFPRVLLEICADARYNKGIGGGYALYNQDILPELRLYKEGSDS